MKYYEVDFSITASEELLQDARDILAAIAGEAGFETFEETPTGLKGYVQQTLFDRDQLNTLLCSFPFEDADISYEVSEAEDRDWNEQWEQEGFEPIIVEGTTANPSSTTDSSNSLHRTVIIHDGRHLPSSFEADHAPLPAEGVESETFLIEIDAHLAFGTGTHQTTRMMVASLLELELEGKRILDCGCGTGILGITALKLGADSCVGYDIDEWSADNARHNAVINQVDSRFSSLLGDASVLKTVEGTFDIVLANINRNILLADMEAFCQKMNPGACLLLSGFYQEDVPILEEKAKEFSLTIVSQKHDGNWTCLMLKGEKVKKNQTLYAK